MYCQNCEMEVAEGKFCPSCGGELSVKEVDNTVVNTEGNTSEQTVETNEYVEKAKNIGSNFVSFFLSLLKKPGEAKNVTSDQIVSSGIMMGIFSFLFSLSYFVMVKSASMGFIKVSFVKNFIVPFFVLFILLAIIASITFGVIKLFGRPTKYTTVLAQYGAYLTPFVLLFLLSIILVLITLTSVAMLILVVIMVGIIFLIPTFLIVDNATEQKFDQVYLLLGTYFVNIIVTGVIFRVLLQSLIQSLFGGIMGGLMGGF